MLKGFAHARKHVLVLMSAIALSTPTLAEDGLKIEELVIAASATDQDATVNAAKGFYEFWNTGDESVLKRAISEQFVDRTLPPGRPQGPEGPAFASRNFHSTIPDLKVTVRKMIVASEYVTVHMNFTGHFTGVFGKTKGVGQAIAFIATDLLKIEKGRVTDNWHLEDNLTLLQQMGVADIRP